MSKLNTLPNLLPSLNLNFAGSGKVDPRVEFTRASEATYWGRGGNLLTASSNTPRIEYDPVSGECLGLLIEGPSTNMLPFSNDLNKEAIINSGWSLGVNTRMSDGRLGPDGKTVSLRLTSIVNSNSYRARSVYVEPGSYTASVYLCADVKPTMGVLLIVEEIQADGSKIRRTLPFTDSAVIADGKWRRYSLTVTHAIGGVCTVYYGSDFGEEVSIDLFGVQYEMGSVASSYIQNKLNFTSRASTAYYFDSKGVLTKAPSNEGRYENHTFINNAWVKTEPLFEKAATNLLKYSEDFDINVWDNTNVSVTPNATIAPDGTLTADKLIATSVNNSHFNGQVALSFTSGKTYTASVFAKAGEYTWTRVFFGASAFPAGARSASFNLANGTLGAVPPGVISRISDAGNGWYRCSITVTAIGAGWDSCGFNVQNADNVNSTGFLGNDSDGIYIWGAQVEEGQYPTSYIPTPSVFTSRASTKTFFDVKGIMRTAAVNQAAIDHGYINGQWISKGLSVEGQATNLLTYSEQFDNALWSKARASVTANATTAPDGTLTADKLVEDTTASSTHYIDAKFISNGTATYTYSVYLKAGERATATVYIADTGITPGTSTRFNLATGVVEFGTQASMVPVGNGWYRCSLYGVPAATSTCVARLLLRNIGDSYSGDGTSGLYIWGAQLEVGSFPTSYIPSTVTFTGRASAGTYIGSGGLIKTAASGEARWNYNPTDLSIAPKLLLEEQRTNLLTHSEQFDNAAWVKSEVSVTPNAINAPDGTVTAYKLVENTVNNQHFIQEGGIPITAGKTLTVSIFAKAGERGFLNISFSGTEFPAEERRAFFDLNAGVVTYQQTNVFATISYIGGGWYRCSATAVVNKTAPSSAIFIGVFKDSMVLPYPGDGTSGIYIWGAQCEEGQYPTSYIKTEATQVIRAADTSTSAQTTRAADIYTSVAATRAADVVTSVASTRALDVAGIKDPANYSWYSQKAGTLVATATAPKYSQTFARIASFENVGTNTMSIQRSGTSNNARGFFASASLDAGANTFPGGVETKTAVTLKEGMGAISVNGGTSVISTDATVDIPIDFTLGISRSRSVNTALNGHIKDVSYYPAFVDPVNQLPTLSRKN